MKNHFDFEDLLKRNPFPKRLRGELTGSRWKVRYTAGRGDSPQRPCGPKWFPRSPPPMATETRLVQYQRGSEADR